MYSLGQPVHVHCLREKDFGLPLALISSGLVPVVGAIKSAIATNLPSGSAPSLTHS